MTHMVYAGRLGSIRAGIVTGLAMTRGPGSGQSDRGALSVCIGVHPWWETLRSLPGRVRPGGQVAHDDEAGLPQVVRKPPGGEASDQRGSGALGLAALVETERVGQGLGDVVWVGFGLHSGTIEGWIKQNKNIMAAARRPP